MFQKTIADRRLVPYEYEKKYMFLSTEVIKGIYHFTLKRF